MNVFVWLQPNFVEMKTQRNNLKLWIVADKPKKRWQQLTPSIGRIFKDRQWFSLKFKNLKMARCICRVLNLCIRVLQKVFFLGIF